jgi:hypothetical protein
MVARLAAACVRSGYGVPCQHPWRRTAAAVAVEKRQVEACVRLHAFLGVGEATHPAQAAYHYHCVCVVLTTTAALTTPACV